MSEPLEVFADITCPFTHVGLKKVISELAVLGTDIDIVVRAWPLEWVNGEPLAAEAVGMKAAALTTQLGVDNFVGFNADAWPSSNLAALNLAASAYRIDNETGLAVSLRLRSAVFEDGLDTSDTEVLTAIAAEFGLDAPSAEASDAVRADYDDGQRRGVKGSPSFFVGSDEVFCPSLQISHSDDGALLAEFDPSGLSDFVEKVAAAQ